MSPSDAEVAMILDTIKSCPNVGKSKSKSSSRRPKWLADASFDHYSISMEAPLSASHKDCDEQKGITIYEPSDVKSQALSASSENNVNDFKSEAVLDISSKSSPISSQVSRSHQITA